MLKKKLDDDDMSCWMFSTGIKCIFVVRYELEYVMYVYVYECIKYYAFFAVISYILICGIYG